MDQNETMHSYPSPNAVAAEPFYSSSTSQQQPDARTAEELQLAAQLSHSNIPNMTSNPENMGDVPDQRGGGSMNHQYHPGNENHNPHLHSPDRSMDHLAAQYGTPEDAGSTRKRSKVSRACDECRRKKIRCDATGEPGDDQCSSCKRVGARCQFSRVPMKRGPSKGYIKELADRLNTLEGAIQSGDLPAQQYMHNESPLQRRGSDDFFPGPNAESPRKRTFAAMSGDFITPYQPQRPQLPHEQPRPLSRHTPNFSNSRPSSGPNHTFRDNDFSANGLQPLPHWRNPPDPPQSDSFESMVQPDHAQIEQIQDLDDSTIDGYYTMIHPTYPLLPHSKAVLSSRLASCPPAIKDAFQSALHAAVRSFPSASFLPREQRGTQKASQLLAAIQFDGSAVRTATTSLVVLQAMLCLAIEAENTGPDPSTGRSRSLWLGSAVSLAYAIKLHTQRTGPQNSSDSEESLSRRVWWSLIIMERWHSSGASSPALIPDGSVIVYPEDEALLGESTYQLARLSIVLGHFTAASIIPTDIPNLGIPPSTIVGTLLRGELERCRESFSAPLLNSSSYPVIHLCWWYLRILSIIKLPDSPPQALVEAASKLVGVLLDNPGTIAPLTHYATALAATTLLDLLKHDSTRQDAETILKSLLDHPIAPSGWDSAIRQMLSKKQNSGLIHDASAANSKAAESQQALVASQGLRRLADLATAGEVGSDPVVEVRKENEQVETLGNFENLKNAITSGYLTKFS